MGTDPVTKSVGKILSSVLPKSVMPKKFTFVHLVVVVVVIFMLYHALTDNVEGYGDINICDMSLSDKIKLKYKASQPSCSAGGDPVGSADNKSSEAICLAYGEILNPSNANKPFCKAEKGNANNISTVKSKMKASTVSGARAKLEAQSNLAKSVFEKGGNYIGKGQLGLNDALELTEAEQSKYTDFIDTHTPNRCSVTKAVYNNKCHMDSPTETACKGAKSQSSKMNCQYSTCSFGSVEDSCLGIPPKNFVISKEGESGRIDRNSCLLGEITEWMNCTEARLENYRDDTTGAVKVGASPGQQNAFKDWNDFIKSNKTAWMKPGVKAQRILVPKAGSDKTTKVSAAKTATEAKIKGDWIKAGLLSTTNPVKTAPKQELNEHPGRTYTITGKGREIIPKNWQDAVTTLARSCEYYPKEKGAADDPSYYRAPAAIGWDNAMNRLECLNYNSALGTDGCNQTYSMKNFHKIKPQSTVDAVAKMQADPSFENFGLIAKGMRDDTKVGSNNLFTGLASLASSSKFDI